MDYIQAMFECTTDAVFGTNQNMQILFWNSVCEEIFNLTKKQAIGRYCYEVVCGYDSFGHSCNKECRFTKFNNKSSPNPNFDLIIKPTNGEPFVANVGSYYTSNVQKHSAIQVFHSLRIISCYQLIQRLSFNLNTTTDTNNNISRLTRREYEILRLLSTGITAKDIARQLSISDSTVRNHFKNIYAKLEVHSKAEAITCAMRHGLI